MVRLSSRLVSVAAMLASLAVAGAAHAQDEAASDGEFSVQRFRPAPGPRNFVNTSGARQDGNMAFSAGFLANYAYIDASTSAGVELRLQALRRGELRHRGRLRRKLTRPR